MILKKKGVNKVDACADGTGYSLTVKRHYATESSRRKDKLKEDNKDKHGRRQFVYSFSILDLTTWLYVAYGMSLKSEKEACDKAKQMLSKTGVELLSIRLDKYHSTQSSVDSFGDTKVYILPKKNATVKGSLKWKKTLEDYARNTLSYLEQYYKRENSESGFAQDKKWFGWKIGQRREDRIDTAVSCSNILHNLFNFHRI